MGWKRRVADRLGLVRTVRDERSSWRAALSRVSSLEVRSVLDIGAAEGLWSEAARSVFPSARFLLVEPLAEWGSDSVRAACGATDGEVTMHVHSEHLAGSSLLAEHQEVATEERVVPVRSVDSLVREHGLVGPYGLKIDVQGGELDVIRGAGATLRDAAFVMMECSLIQFFVGGPVFSDILEAMEGFVPFDIYDLSYRPRDGFLGQFDVTFVPEDSPLRSVRTWD